ncbi:MAG: phage shock protein operon transcriptional activator [Desulfobacteraceae bacterium 4572_89]|nr:MAG: phage shock protein operon transcriptional activator [Desulfobacteraceae bacterium 4572_89]
MSFSSQGGGAERSVSMSGALGQSEAFIEFQEQISQVAPIDRPVLILGERGTGKELAAARIHFLSKRWQKPLVTLNCAALTPSLIGSELFGYEKGAFTGAGTRQAGRFEQAADGTLFLDEIGSIPMEVQEKILRVVEYGSFERVGSSRPVQVDVRIVAAANVDLSAMAARGRFKQDLLDRLSFEVIYVPPLRFRKEDILLLANHFAGRMAFELGWEEIPRLTKQAAKTLEAYAWPGNIRELKNVIERAVYKSGSHMIEDISFDPFQSIYGEGLLPSVSPSDKVFPVPRENNDNSAGDQVPSRGLSGKGQEDILEDLLEKPLKESIQALERYRLGSAMESCRFNQKKAAAKLGLSYDQFRGLKKKYDQDI